MPGATGGQDSRENANKESEYGRGAADRYAASINRWLWQCYYSQCFSLWLPYVALQSVQFNQRASSPATATDINRNFPSFFLPDQNLPPTAQSHVPTSHREASQHPRGQEFLIPPLWKRFAAEAIDFLILLVLKLIVTYIAVDFFELVNLDKYDFNILRDEKLYYKAVLEMTSEIVTLEVIHRLIVCLFEALCLHRGTVTPGGATPGKSLVGLKVVSCTSVEPLDANRVRVFPAQDIGIGWSTVRAVIKNFSLAFFLPVCFTIFFFQHNRSVYDLVCSCMVVEEIPQNNRRH